MRRFLKITVGLALMACFAFSGLATSQAQAKLTITQARAAADGTAVSVQGLVNSTPGAFDAQNRRFYIQDAVSGLAIYFNDGGLPALVEGDTVTVTGSQARDGSNLGIAQTILFPDGRKLNFLSAYEGGK